MIVDVNYNNKTSSQLVMSFINVKGLIELMPFHIHDQPYRFTKWVYANEQYKPISNYISYDNRPVSLTYDKRFNKFDLMQFLHNLSPEVQKKLLAFNQPQLFFFDIETEIEDEFPDAETAKTPIISIAITAFDSKFTTVVFTTDYDRINESVAEQIRLRVNAYIKAEYDAKLDVDVRVIACKSEYEMLKRFLVAFKQMPAMSAWNSDGYDWPYIKNRLAKNGLSMSEASIDGSLDSAGLPKHKVIKDYMQLFKDYEYSMRPYESYALNYVANKSLKLSKLVYPGTLKSLRENDIVTFLAYNAIDTIILALLHKKHNLYNVLYGLTLVTSLPMRLCEGPVNQAEAVMFKYFLAKRDANNNVIVCPEKGKTPTYKYEGGFVKDPVKHFAKYTACFDYSSLYPSIMRTHNISPMNLIRQLQTNELEKYKNDPNYFISSLGRLYDNSEDYAYKEVQSVLYAGRKSFQGDQFFYYNEVWFEIQKEKKRRGLIESL
jgi:DNA polymerase elongation subunit (family B)